MKVFLLPYPPQKNPGPSAQAAEYADRLLRRLKAYFGALPKSATLLTDRKPGSRELASALEAEIPKTEMLHYVFTSARAPASQQPPPFAQVFGALKQVGTSTLVLLVPEGVVDRYAAEVAAILNVKLPAALSVLTGRSAAVLFEPDRDEPVRFLNL